MDGEVDPVVDAIALGYYGNGRDEGRKTARKKDVARRSCAVRLVWWSWAGGRGRVVVGRWLRLWVVVVGVT